MSIPAGRGARRGGGGGGERGFTLIEVLISVATALFLLAGLLTVLQNIGATRTNQASLAQLQDNQRVAMTLIAEVIQSAGYFPDPTTNTQAAALPSTVVSGATLAAGQALYGTYLATGPGDTITARFATLSGDTIINCIGGTNTSGALVTYVNTFSITNSQLACSLNGAAATPLVNGLNRMDVWYGVKRDLTTDNFSVDTYLGAEELTAADWSNVSSVKVRLTFDNPLAALPGQPATVRFTRIIAIMGRVGVKL